MSNITKRSLTSLTNCLIGKGISVLGNVFANENITLKKRPVYKNVDWQSQNISVSILIYRKWGSY